MMQSAEEWLLSAYTDLGVAKHLRETYYPKPLEVICFHAQQAAEKSLKALIISKALPGGLPKVHDLSFLLNQLKNTVLIDEKYFDYADSLTPYAVSAKYPNELFLKDEHAEKAIKYAEEIYLWVKDSLSE